MNDIYRIAKLRIAGKWRADKGASKTFLAVSSTAQEFQGAKSKKC